MADKRHSNIEIPQEADSKFKLINEIKNCPLYKSDHSSTRAYESIKDRVKADSMKNAAVPGQLILFNYFEPKTEEQLEYYDATPCTLFFSYFKSKEGLRILGFNIHYYPTKMRFHIMSKIFEIYKPIYVKYFTEPLTHEIDAFDYKYLMDALKRAKLDFGVREYIPELCGQTWKIPANMWHVAVFTEGHFKKRTRESIINYWNNWKSHYYENNKKKQKQSQQSNASKQSRKPGFLKRLMSRFKQK